MTSSTVIADLRSDTLTQPSPDMREVMMSAQTGDDVYGEDPTVHELEQYVAGLLGHEAGLFCPTGSMSNWLGVRSHVAPGAEVVCDDLAHIVRAELGSHGAFAGVTTRTWPAHIADTPVGQIQPDVISDLTTPKAGPYLVSTAAISVENTHNFGGGTIQPLDALRQVSTFAHENNVALHMDGARLWNACAATGHSLAEYAALCDTVSVCLSKGLGAPVGSLLVGSQHIIDEARVWRKRAGGGMRQIGMLAAAGRYAIDNHRVDLFRDHRNAVKLATAIAEAAPHALDPATVETNIVAANVANPVEIVELAATRGVRASALGKTTVRFVTYRDLTDEAIAHATSVLSDIFACAVALP